MATQIRVLHHRIDDAGHPVLTIGEQDVDVHTDAKQADVRKLEFRKFGLIFYRAGL
ncbi:hypothetical protein [Vibrio maritimus]|uniref:hypothetical protein n=1 Tax=Vibrio maritimus TaxID=990268 RepID=UPI0037362BA8